jgi:hypothetical protein
MLNMHPRLVWFCGSSAFQNVFHLKCVEILFFYTSISKELKGTKNYLKNFFQKIYF